MIRLLEELTPAFVRLCGEDIFGSRILAAARSYGFQLAGSQFWIQSDGTEKLTAALALVDGFALLRTDGADWEELAVFLKMLSWDQLQCAAEDAAHLPYPTDWISCLMSFSAAKRTSISAQISPAKDVGDVYDLLAQCFSDMKDRALWMADLALRWRRGTAESWFIGAVDGSPLGTASAFAVTERHAFLGAVGTLPEARGQGFAGELAARLAEIQQARGRAVWLSCRAELAEFYQSVGFEPAGNMITMRKGDC
ncbi:MAG: GNAT family N-acetyltransferase [Oscillospiraceae bacterium]|jgi:ribosomal protein S18 acetylase RimI-like enzyme|nr:GNAT family N-acetyltransferase [Oscillospiraceae bacterium]